VIFQYNGHSFDALEVLGLHSSANLEDAKKAYAALLAKQDEDSEEFLKCAIQAFEIEFKKRSKSA
jgi:hypothetical protein